MAEKIGVGALYFEVKLLLWQYRLAAPLLSVQVVTGLPHMDKSRTQWPWGRKVVYLLSLGPCN